MAKIVEQIKLRRQNYHANRLRSEAIRDNVGDPNVRFHAVAIDDDIADHGVNVPDEMTQDAEPVTD